MNGLMFDRLKEIKQLQNDIKLNEQYYEAEYRKSIISVILIVYYNFNKYKHWRIVNGRC